MKNSNDTIWVDTDINFKDDIFPAPSREKLFAQLGTKMLSHIFRNTYFGKDYNGQRFAPYSREYYDYKEMQGGSVDIVNLTSVADKGNRFKNLSITYDKKGKSQHTYTADKTIKLRKSSTKHMVASVKVQSKDSNHTEVGADPDQQKKVIYNELNKDRIFLAIGDKMEKELDKTVDDFFEQELKKA